MGKQYGKDKHMAWVMCAFKVNTWNESAVCSGWTYGVVNVFTNKWEGRQIVFIAHDGSSCRVVGSIPFNYREN